MPIKIKKKITKKGTVIPIQEIAEEVLKEIKLEEKAEKNARVTMKKGSDDEVVLKDGEPLEHSMKHNLLARESVNTVGLNKGATVNLGDYQSLRVDCWVTTSLIEGETEQQALDRISTVINDRIEIEVNKVTG